MAIDMRDEKFPKSTDGICCRMEEILIWRMVFVPPSWKYHSGPIENRIY
jgi:hypothetical protein